LRDDVRRYLMVRAGEDLCALPLERVRRVVRDLQVLPLPGASTQLKGLAEFGGEPLAVLDLTAVVGAARGANPQYSVTVVAMAGPADHLELVGLAVDAALEVVDVAADDVAVGGEGIVRGDVAVDGEPVRVISLAALGG
jgi:chemotaxis signal transduction protein